MIRQTSYLETQGKSITGQRVLGPEAIMGEVVSPTALLFKSALQVPKRWNGKNSGRRFQASTGAGSSRMIGNPRQASCLIAGH